MEICSGKVNFEKALFFNFGSAMKFYHYSNCNNKNSGFLDVVF